MTLTELMVTLLIMLVVVLGALKLDLSQTIMTITIRKQMAAAQPNRFGTGLAALKIGESLARADRAIITGPDGDGLYALQIRVSDCTGEDTACGNWEERHRWEQYNVDTATTPWSLVYYASDHTLTTLLPCGKRRVLAQEITGLEFHFEDEETLSPPGGEPNFSPNQPSGSGEDNNMVSYALTWSNGTHTQTFKGEAMTRAQGYTDVAEGGLSDPRFGDPSPPPVPLCEGPANTIRAPRSCTAWNASFGGWPCTGRNSPFCYPDPDTGVMSCISASDLCGIVTGVADRERRSYCVDVPAGSSKISLGSIYYDGPPQCGRFYHVLTPPEESGMAPETCGGSAAEGGRGICSWMKSNPPTGMWYIDVIGDTPGGTCDENSLVMYLQIS